MTSKELEGFEIIFEQTSALKKATTNIGQLLSVILAILIEKGVVSEEQLDEALSLVKKEAERVSPPGSRPAPA